MEHNYKDWEVGGAGFNDDRKTIKASAFCLQIEQILDGVAPLVADPSSWNSTTTH